MMEKAAASDGGGEAERLKISALMEKAMRTVCMASTCAVGRTLWAVIMPVQWSHDILYLLLNAPNEKEKKELTRAWQKNKLADLKRVGITAALVAGVISGAFSWYVVERTSWRTKGMWYSGLVSALTSISTAGLHINCLLRLSCMADWEERLRVTLGRPMDDLSGRWRPRTMQPWIWQAPSFMLKLAMLLFIVGLAVAIWEQAMATELRWGSDELKIAVMFTVTGAFAFTNYALSVSCLFVRTLDLK